MARLAVPEPCFCSDDCWNTAARVRQRDALLDKIQRVVQSICPAGPIRDISGDQARELLIDLPG